MPFVDFLDYFNANILGNDEIVLHNAVLYPPTFEDLIDINWRVTDKPLTTRQRLKVYDASNRWKPMLVDLVARFDFLKRLRQGLLDRSLYARQEVVSKNWESSTNLHSFGFSNDAEHTLALREYFVPMKGFEVFVLNMRNVLIRHDVNVLNVSIRYSPRDSESLLAWAKDDMLSFVIVYRQGKDEESLKRVSAWSSELIDSAVKFGGSYYLPFQIQESSEQFYHVYPRAREFFALKKQVDPDNRFNNMLLQKHRPKEIDSNILQDTKSSAAARQLQYYQAPAYAYPPYNAARWWRP
jgi:hypothetical protein